MVKTEKAMFGAGCFWGVEYEFQKMPGVVKTKVGYSGGKDKAKVTYEEVSTGETGHAEVVYIEFNPDEISYPELLDIFWRAHDPTTENMQWPDVGSQYRSVIFYFNDKQKKDAEASFKRMQNIIHKKIVTQIIKAGKFYPAEDYHQDYVNKHGVNSCHLASNPYLR